MSEKKLGHFLKFISPGPSFCGFAEKYLPNLNSEFDHMWLTNSRIHQRTKSKSISTVSLFKIAYFQWRRIGEPISDRHFLYLSTLSRNSGNGFELRVSTLVEKVKHHLLQPCLPGESLLRNDTVTTIRLDFWKGELSHGDHIMTLYREWTTRRRVFLARCQ